MCQENHQLTYRSRQLKMHEKSAWFYNGKLHTELGENALIHKIFIQ